MDPYTRPILTELGGKIAFEDLGRGYFRAGGDRRVEPASPSARSSTGGPRHAGSDLKPAITVLDEKGKVSKMAKGNDSRFLLSVESILSVEPGAMVAPGDVSPVCRWKAPRPRTSPVGLPRVAELVEARRPKDHAVIGRDRRHDPLSGATTRTSAASSSSRMMEGLEPGRVPDPQGQRRSTFRGRRHHRERATTFSTGNQAHARILAIKGVEALASYLVNEDSGRVIVCSVWSSTTKHIRGESFARRSARWLRSRTGRLDLHPGATIVD